MRRLLVLLALASVGSASVLVLPACGGNDKPPLTPDNIEGTENPEAGAPSTPAAPTPPK